GIRGRAPGYLGGACGRAKAWTTRAGSRRAGVDLLIGPGVRPPAGEREPNARSSRAVSPVPDRPPRSCAMNLSARRGILPVLVLGLGLGLAPAHADTGAGLAAITEASVQTSVGYLAADELQGRGSGAAGGALAG